MNPETESDPVVHDQVLVETRIGERPVAFRAVVVNLQTSSLWLGLARPDPQLERLERGQPLHLTFKRDNAAVVGDSAFVSHLGSSKSRLFAVGIPADARLVQRRAHIRLPIECPISAAVIGEGEGAGAGRRGRGTTRNICAGGLQFSCDLPIPVGSEIELAVELGPGERVAAQAVVVRVEEIEAGSAPPRPANGNPSNLPQPSSLVAVRFLAISEVDQDKIVRRIFSAQRARREDTKKAS